MYAARYDHLECVKILAPLEKGTKDKNGRTAKYYASSKNHKDCADYLSQFPEENAEASDKPAVSSCTCSKDLFEAAEKGCEKCCRKYID